MESGTLLGEPALKTFIACGDTVLSAMENLERNNANPKHRNSQLLCSRIYRKFPIYLAYICIWKDFLNKTQNLLDFHIYVIYMIYIEGEKIQYFVPYIPYMCTEVEKLYICVKHYIYSTFSYFIFLLLFRNSMFYVCYLVVSIYILTCLLTKSKVYVYFFFFPNSTLIMEYYNYNSDHPFSFYMLQFFSILVLFFLLSHYPLLLLF